MSTSNDKPVVISFRADEHLAELLNQLPDKSAFIRKAILSHFYQACPICKGRGVVPESIAQWLKQTLDHEKLQECECCSYEFPATAAAGKKSSHFLCDHCQEHEHEH
ncbi:MAG: hypothetical protein HJJLKODD_02311 [Phycisphaerae bacterium]|nr:hypothetical protein [Phycisphaerae bacterium]